MLTAYFAVLAVLALLLIFAKPSAPKVQGRFERFLAFAQMALLAAYCYTGTTALFVLAMVCMAMSFGIGFGKDRE